MHRYSCVSGFRSHVGKGQTEVISNRGHLRSFRIYHSSPSSELLILPSVSRSYGVKIPSWGRFELGSIRDHCWSMTRIIVQSHFSDGSSLSWYLGWTFRVLFWTFVVYFWIFNFGLSSDYRDCVTIRLSNFIKNSSNFHQNVTASQTKILVLNQR